jgi:hypothetical protein
MKLSSGRRRGIASIIGTIFFVIVLMVALGALAYMSSVQAQSNQVGQQAQLVVDRKGQENLQYIVGSSGLTLSNAGAATSKVVAMLLSYPNGTVYNLNSGSAPSFTAITLPANANALVTPMVPSGTCTPGTTSCLSRYNAIISNPGVGNIGLVTSLGNAYWSNPVSTSLPNSCGGVGTLSMQVSPAGTGMTNPGSITEYCNGQQVMIEAYAAPGYVFSSWTGSGTGSYSGSTDPATATVNNMITETANFVSGSGGPYPLGDPVMYMTTSDQTTSSTIWVNINPLSFTGLPNTPYQITLNFEYYQTIATSPGIQFGVHLPSGATISACGDLVYPDEVQSNCVTSGDTAIGWTFFPGDFTFSSNYCNGGPTVGICDYQATIIVMFGSAGGAFQVEWDVAGSTTGTLKADSVMIVTPG